MDKFQLLGIIITKTPEEKKVIAVLDGLISLKNSVDMQKNIFKVNGL